MARTIVRFSGAGSGPRGTAFSRTCVCGAGRVSYESGGRKPHRAEPRWAGKRPSPVGIVFVSFRGDCVRIGRDRRSAERHGQGRREGIAADERKGAMTIAQDRESAVVPGMPGEAIDLGAVMYVLTPDKIVETLGDLVL